MRKTPQDFAAFIHMHHDDLDQAGIGEYLGELGKTDTDQTFMTELRRTLRRKSHYMIFSVAKTITLGYTGT